MKRAEAALREDLQKYSEDTLWQDWKGPQTAAAIALARNKPLDAIEALRRSVPYDLRDTEVRTLRGRAFLAANRPDDAEREFRKVTAQPTAGAPSANVVPAHPGVARAPATLGDSAGSRAEYERLFALWKDAEPDVPVLRNAKAEYLKVLGGEKSPATTLARQPTPGRRDGR